MSRFAALRRLPAGAALGLVLLLVLAVYLTGGTRPLDRLLLDQRFALLDRPATNSLAIVEIDPRSLAALDRWPWPRRFHAQAISRLLDADVTEIAYDVDFSARSTPSDDAALEAALDRASQRIILPVFHQTGRAEDDRIEIIRTAPLPRFTEPVQLGGVTMVPDSDGLIRHTTVLERLGDQTVPTMPALLAGPGASHVGRFGIDFSIDPSQIPRFSFVDVIRGAVDPARLSGRKVIVGATAAELGDLHAVPTHTVLSGPMIQALAYESLVQGRTLRALDSVAVVLLTALVMIALSHPFRNWTWQRALPLALAAMAGVEAIVIGTQALFPVTVETVPIHMVIALGFLVGLLHTVEMRAIQLFRQRMAIAHRRRLMARVLEDSFDGVAITDAAGRIEVFNKAAGRILDVRADKAVGQHMGKLIPEAAELLDDAEQDTVAPLEMKVIRQDGTPIVLEMTATRLTLQTSRNPLERRTAGRALASYIFRDITERSRAAAAERRAKDAALAANEAKTAFLANMSHELRTPLNAIIGFSDMIRNEIRGPISDDYKGYITGIHDSGHHLLSVINDILHVAKIESGSFTLNEAPFDLGQCLSACLMISQGWPDIANRNLVTALPEEGIEVYGDETLIRQMVINLMSNAVKYSHTGDRISLRVLRGQDGGVTIEVGDTGIGIESKMIPMLTKPFYQVDGSLSRKFEGTGLGLALVAAYAKAHDGNLSIKSTPGVGTTVRLILPPERIHRIRKPEEAVRKPLPKSLFLAGETDTPANGEQGGTKRGKLPFLPPFSSPPGSEEE